MPRRTSPSIAALALALLIPACAPDLDPGGDDEAAEDDSGDGDGDGDVHDDLPDDPQMDHESSGDHIITQVDATDAEVWIYMDLESGRQVDQGDDSWDLRFQRYNIAVNGGISGDADVGVAWVPEADLEGIDTAPASGWTTDAADGDDDDEEPDLAFATWYDYDPETHILTPKSGVYVVRTADADYGVELLDYYSDAGTSGYPTFAWRLLDAAGK